jgi:hypothetical protein
VRLLATDNDGLLFLSTAEIADPAARAALERIASDQPQQLVGIRRPGNEIRQSSLRVSADGLFVNGRKAIDLDRFVVRAERSAIREIVSRDRFLNTRTGLLVGVLAGFAAGSAYAAMSDEICYGCGIFPLTGGIIGAVWGRRAARPERQVVYRKAGP